MKLELENIMKITHIRSLIRTTTTDVLIFRIFYKYRIWLRKAVYSQTDR